MFSSACLSREHTTNLIHTMISGDDALIDQLRLLLNCQVDYLLHLQGLNQYGNERRHRGAFSIEESSFPLKNVDFRLKFNVDFIIYIGRLLRPCLRADTFCLSAHPVRNDRARNWNNYPQQVEAHQAAGCHDVRFLLPLRWPGAKHKQSPISPCAVSASFHRVMSLHIRPALDSSSVDCGAGSRANVWAALI